MKELFKEYLQSVTKSKIILGGNVFFATYSVEGDVATVDNVFINPNKLGTVSIEKIINAIDTQIEAFGFELHNICYELSIEDVNFLSKIGVLLLLGYDKHQHIKGNTIILTRGI